MTDEQPNSIRGEIASGIVRLVIMAAAVAVVSLQDPELRRNLRYRFERAKAWAERMIDDEPAPALVSQVLAEAEAAKDGEV